MDTLRIAQAQINPTVGDFEGNIAAITDAMARARDCAADIVTFPELAICGYPPEDLLLRPQFLRDSREAVEEVARRSEGIGAVLGFPDVMDGTVYNAAAVVSGGHLIGVHHKVELPNYGVFDEERYFSRGSGCAIIECGGTRIALTICEDVWIEGGEVEQCEAINEATVVLNISASPFHAGKLASRRDVLANFARRTGAFVCYTNLVGAQDELVFDGGSLVISPQGELLATAKRFEEDLLVTDIEMAESGGSEFQPRQAAGQWKKRIVIESRPADRPGAPATHAPKLGRLDEVYRALVLGTRDYARKNGFETVVIGLSGGIDSSLTAAIAVDALGADNVVAVTMPSQYSSNETILDAGALAENLDMRLITVPVERVYSGFLDALEEPFGAGAPGIAYENIQARIRGTILMGLSNRFGWLVLTTGNKSEFAVGYCTLYGDMAGGFAVIKDVPKTLVYELAEYVNNNAGREVIPGSVIARAPTAELKPDQKDEDSLPPYTVLDPILRGYVEEDKAPDEVAAGGFDAAIVKDVVHMVDRSEYKRRQAPPGVKITPKAFGKDRRLPITNRYGTSAKSNNKSTERHT